MSKVSLRTWQKQDAQALASVANNRKIWNNVHDDLPNPYTVMDALQWVAHANSQNPVLDFAVLHDGQVVGSIGCLAKTDIYRKTIEIGYFIGETYWGKGIATEAVNQLAAFITEKLDMARIEAHVFAHNRASMKVLEKCGFHLEAIHRKAAVKNNELLDDHVWVKLL